MPTTGQLTGTAPAEDGKGEEAQHGQEEASEGAYGKVLNIVVIKT